MNGGYIELVIGVINQLITGGAPPCTCHYQIRSVRRFTTMQHQRSICLHPGPCPSTTGNWRIWMWSQPLGDPPGEKLRATVLTGPHGTLRSNHPRLDHFAIVTCGFTDPDFKKHPDIMFDHSKELTQPQATDKGFLNCRSPRPTDSGRVCGHRRWGLEDIRSKEWDMRCRCNFKGNLVVNNGIWQFSPQKSEKPMLRQSHVEYRIAIQM